MDDIPNAIAKTYTKHEAHLNLLRMSLKKSLNDERQPPFDPGDNFSSMLPVF